MSAAASQPIGVDELTRLLEPALAAPVALAVSGGADSMALMHLVARWLARPGCTARDSQAWVMVFTVDHQLRLESAAEADFVKVQAQRLGFTHRTLQWSGEKPGSGLQAAAREVRYALMTSAIQAEGDSSAPRRSLVTAHHADDQAETLLMRLARGSGAAGLAGMRAHGSVNGVSLLRPLLGVPKARLIATLQAYGAAWVDDRSNSNTAFERVRLRQARAQLEALGFDNERLALSAARLARADAALERLTSELSVKASTDRHGGAYVTLDLATFRAGDAEPRIRLLARLLAANGGQCEGPRLSQIEDLDSQICDPASGGALHGGSTLGGCSVRWNLTGRLQIFREEGRAGLPELGLTVGQAAVWDRRFRVAVANDSAQGIIPLADPVCVRALGGGVYATLRPFLRHAVPALAGATLPAFFVKNKLIAVPYFGDQLAHCDGVLQRPDLVCSARAAAGLTADDQMCGTS